MTTLAPKDFSGNWLGTTTPVVSNADTTEPGYAAQIPVAFGGTAVNPGGAPQIAGVGAANVGFTPYLDSGLDTNSGFGTYGFQGDFSSLTVTAELNQVGATKRVQEGHDALVAGGTLHVRSPPPARRLPARCASRSRTVASMAPATCSSTSARTRRRH